MNEQHTIEDNPDSPLYRDNQEILSRSSYFDLISSIVWGKEGKTKQEILLYLSDGTRKLISDIKRHVMTELHLKQSSGINRHLRDLERVA